MLKIKRLNRNGNEVETLIIVENIDGVSEKEMDTKKFFDESGNLVKEEPVESIYYIHFTNGREIYVTKATYNKLVQKLSVEEL